MFGEMIATDSDYGPGKLYCGVDTHILSASIIAVRNPTRRFAAFAASVIEAERWRRFSVDGEMAQLTADKSGTPNLSAWPITNLAYGVRLSGECTTSDSLINSLLGTLASCRIVLIDPVASGFPGLSESFKVARYSNKGFEGWSSGIDWVIVRGSQQGETNLEPMRDVVAQCVAAKVPIYVRDLGVRPYEIGSETGERTRIGVSGTYPDTPGTWPIDLRWRQRPKWFGRGGGLTPDHFTRGIAYAAAYPREMPLLCDCGNVDSQAIELYGHPPCTAECGLRMFPAVAG